MKKYILSLILLFIAFPVSAETIISQLNSDLDSYFTSSDHVQSLGTGISGTVESVDYYVHAQSGSYTSGVKIYKCDDANASVNCSLVYTGGATQTVGTTKQLVHYDLSDNYLSGLAPFVFDVTKYYWLQIHSGQAGAVYGNSNLFGDSYLGGEYCKASYVINCGDDSDVQDMYFVFDDGTGFNDLTRIISVTPYDGEVVASTTPTEIGFEAYINGDYDSSTLTFKVQRLNDLNDYGGMSGQVWEYSTTTNEVGTISYSKIVPSLVSFLDPGNYILTLDIRPSTIFSFFTPTSVATSTMFYVGDATRFGLDYAKSQDEYRDFFSDISQSATSSLADFCDFTSPLGGWLTGGLVENTWDIGKCLRSLLVPNAIEVKAVFDSYKGQVLYAFPLGYVTRSVDIMTGTTTLPLPALTYTFENDFPSVIFAGKTFGFDFTEIASDASDILDTQFVSASDDKTVWEIFEPYIRTVFALLLAWLIIVDLMSIELNTGFGSTVGSAYRQGRTVIKRKWRDL